MLGRWYLERYAERFDTSAQLPRDSSALLGLFGQIGCVATNCLLVEADQTDKSWQGAVQALLHWSHLIARD